jgi:Icc-related predicted phosphoesterase
MKILHLSDLHGLHTAAVERLVDAHEPDWIVLAGDMLPDLKMIRGKDNRLDCHEWPGQAGILHTSDLDSSLNEEP